METVVNESLNSGPPPQASEPAGAQVQVKEASSAIYQQLLSACEVYPDLTTTSMPPAPLQPEDHADSVPQTTPSKKKKKVELSFAEQVAWDLIEGVTPAEKATRVTQEIKALAELTGLSEQRIFESKGVAEIICDFIADAPSAKSNSANASGRTTTELGDNESESFVSAALSRYRSIVLRLGFGGSHEADEISDATVERSYKRSGTFRTLIPEKLSEQRKITPQLLKALTNSSLDESKICDLLHLAAGARLTPIPARREVVAKIDATSEIDDKFADREREINNFYAAIKWNDIEGQTAAAKVVSFLDAAEEVSSSASSKKKEIEYNGAFGHWILAHMRGKKLAAMDISARFKSPDALPQDPESLLRRNVAMRGTFRTQAMPGTPYLSSYLADSILRTAKVSLADRAILSDVWNLVHGGEFVPKSLWLKYLKAAFERDNKSKSELAYTVSKNETVIALLQKINWRELPGENARSKAISALMLLAKLGGQRQGDSLNFSEDSLAVRNADAAALGEIINKAVRSAKAMSAPERELLVEALRQGHGAGTGHFELTSRVLSVEMLSSELLQHVGKIANVLGSTSHFGTARTQPKPRKIDPWEEVAGLDELNQLREALPSELIQAAQLPDLFTLRFESSPPLGLRTPETRSTEKAGDDTQLLYMLIDCSGSMNHPSRIGTAVALLTNRLVAVSRGDASLYYRFFDSNAHSEVTATDKKQAAMALSSVMRGHYSGGGTSIDTAIRSGVQSIEQVLKINPLVKPELNVVSDGDDRVSIQLSELHGIKLHVFLVGGQKNDYLEKLALQSGGMVLRVGMDGSVLEVREHL